MEEEALAFSVQENLSRIYNLDERLVEFSLLMGKIAEAIERIKLGVLNQFNIQYQYSRFYRFM